jgi:hypothetical protein
MPQSSVTTSFAVAFPGMNGDASDSGDNYLSRLSGETTVQIPPGVVVMQAATPSDSTAQLVTTAVRTAPGALRMLGVLAYNPFNNIANQLGNVADANGVIGLQPKAPLRIKYRGALYVFTDEAVNPALRVRIRTGSPGSGIVAGTFRTSAIGGDSMDLTPFCRWGGTFAAGFALLSFDFRMAGSALIDA